MRAVGFRAEKDRVHWAIVEGTPQSPVLVAHDKFSAPNTYDEADKLVWYRQRILSLVEQHELDRAAVRACETALKSKPKPNVLASMLTRTRIEGVIVEAAASQGLPVLNGVLNTMSAKLKTKRAKGYLESQELRGIDLSSIPKLRQEAVLVAVAALESKNED